MLLERCYDKDPAKRPSCVEIADIFEREVKVLVLLRFAIDFSSQVLFECAMPDPVLRKVWDMGKHVLFYRFSSFTFCWQ